MSFTSNEKNLIVEMSQTLQGWGLKSNMSLPEFSEAIVETLTASEQNELIDRIKISRVEKHWKNIFQSISLGSDIRLKEEKLNSSPYVLFDARRLKGFAYPVNPHKERQITDLFILVIGDETGFKALEIDFVKLRALDMADVDMIYSKMINSSKKEDLLNVRFLPCIYASLSSELRSDAVAEKIKRLSLDLRDS